jgi:hypothetical protein
VAPHRPRVQGAGLHHAMQQRLTWKMFKKLQIYSVSICTLNWTPSSNLGSSAELGIEAY